MKAVVPPQDRFLNRYFKLWHIKRLLIFIIVDVILLSFVRRRKSDSIFILRFDLLGDYIIGRKFLRAIRDYPPYRSRKLILCANVALRDFIETYDSDVFDEFIWIDRVKLLDTLMPRLRMLRQIKRLGCQVAIHPTYGREPYMGDCLIRATGAPERIGREGYENPFVPPGKSKRPHTKATDVFYTRLVHEDHRIAFDFDRNRSFFSELLPGVVLPVDTRFTPIPVPIPDSAGPFAVLMPGASQPIREWPPERFAQVARYLYESRGLRSVVMGTEADRPKAEAILRLGPENAVDDLCGRLTLSQVAYIASLCVVGITNDSGGIHVLAALDRLGVAISNGSTFGMFHPYPPELAPSVTFVYSPAFYASSLSILERKERFSRGERFPIADVSAESVIERLEAQLRGDFVETLL